MLIRTLLLLVLLAFPVLAACGEGDSPIPLSTFVGRGFELSQPLSVEEIERKALEDVAEFVNAPRVPFGFSNAEWERFKSQIQPGDLILRAKSAPKTWAGPSGGWRGLFLVRKDLVVDAFTEAVS